MFACQSIEGVFTLVKTPWSILSVLFERGDKCATPLIKMLQLGCIVWRLFLIVLLMCGTFYYSKLLSCNTFNCLIGEIEDLP